MQSRNLMSFLFCAGLLIIAPVRAATLCPATGHYYDFVAQAEFQNWFDARDEAAAAGGYLVTITSAAEQACLEAQAPTSTPRLRSWWTGGSDAAVEAAWRWVTGPETGRQFWQGFGGGSTTAPDFYANWFAGEPNSSGEDFMVFNGPSNFGWNDVSAYNSTISGYIVEYDEDPSGPPDADDDGVPDDSDNCPDDPNTGQENNDGDALGDVCDDDDDNDGVEDVADNCPTEANPLQEDFDLDGLGNACDPTFGGDDLIQEIELLVLELRAIILAVNPPGGNGLIAKLTGNGGVLAKIGNALTAFGAGLIDVDTYLAELASALDKLAAFDQQLAAKIANGQVPAVTEGDDLQALSADILSIIEALISAVGG